LFLDQLKVEKETSEGSKNGSSNPAESEEEIGHWLMKSEPESRIEKGVDMKVCMVVY